MITDRDILRHIEKQPRKEAGYKQLVREMRVHGDDRRRLAQQLDELTHKGQLIEDDGRYRLAEAVAAKPNQVLGQLTMHRDGYGFVIPDDEQTRDRLNGDIYIHPQAIGSAMHGDRVLVEIKRIRDDARAEGRIMRVVGRQHATVVGTFHYGDRFNFVHPMDTRLAQDIIIPRGKEIPEERVDPHRVLGEEVKRRATSDLEGVVVDVEITDWPTATQNPKGRVVEVLGSEDDFGVDVEIVIRKYHIPHRFPLEVLDEAQRIDPRIGPAERTSRRDYRHQPIVTIDGETARDFDDAVFVRRLSSGNFELQVHIADVAHYVREGTPIDVEARTRGTSVYFPDRAVPMLPMELSTDICSLRPHVERLVLSCTMEIDRRGEILRYEINEGIIKSQERMTYTNVHGLLEGDASLRKRYASLLDVFELMRELAMILNRKRGKRGSIDFDLPEPVIEFDEEGLMQGVKRSERNVAHRLIEEFMLAANECVATYLAEKGVASLYRIHEKPDPKKVFDFETLAASFGYSLGVGALPVKRVTMRAERRERRGTGTRAHVHEVPEDVHITPRMYQKLTEKIAGKPEERILSYLMLRSLKQARYSEENVGHFALAAPTYTHFTSPIRRYPDLIVHRILKYVLRDSAEQMDGDVAVGVGNMPESETPSPWSKRVPHEAPKRGKKHRDEPEQLPGPIAQDVLHQIAEESSTSERRADDAERELMDWKKARFMEDRVGEEFDALIISVTKYGFFVELMELFIEGLVPIATLEGDRYMFDDSAKEIVGQRSRRTFSLGERVRVLVDRIDREAKKINFALVEERPPRAQRKHRKA